MKKLTDNLIMHVYRVDRNTDDEFVDENFEDFIRERFLHLHHIDDDGNTMEQTYVIRLLSSAGELVEDEEEIEHVYEALQETFELDEVIKNMSDDVPDATPVKEPKILH